MFNAGLVKYRGTASFRSNGQYEQQGRFTWNSPGGAILNVGDMEVNRSPWIRLRITLTLVLVRTSMLSGLTAVQCVSFFRFATT